VSSTTPLHFSFQSIRIVHSRGHSPSEVFWPTVSFLIQLAVLIAQLMTVSHASIRPQLIIRVSSSTCPVRREEYKRFPSLRPLEVSALIWARRKCFALQASLKNKELAHMRKMGIRMQIHVPEALLARFEF
jgi:hypothetical protein